MIEKIGVLSRGKLSTQLDRLGASYILNYFELTSLACGVCFRSHHLNIGLYILYIYVYLHILNVLRPNFRSKLIQLAVDYSCKLLYIETPA